MPPSAATAGRPTWTEAWRSALHAFHTAVRVVGFHVCFDECETYNFVDNARDRKLETGFNSQIHPGWIVLSPGACCAQRLNGFALVKSEAALVLVLASVTQLVCRELWGVGGDARL